MTDGGDLIPLREPPEGFLTDRDVDRVLAVLDDPTQVTEERERYEQELAAGRFLVAVPAGDDLKAKVAEVLGRHGAHDMEHFGEYHDEPLGSARNEEVGT